MNWQPIETAPKDGTWVILRFRYMVVSGYHTEKWGWQTPAEDPGFPPTHWLPLPPFFPGGHDE